jgi:lysyl-tRNA synthetase class 1
VTTAATESKAWPFEEARKVLKRAERLDRKTVTFETGYGPSGLPHIGTFAEVARTTMVINAFRQLSDLPTSLFVFSDDMDGLRRAPENVPNRALLEQHLGYPLTKVPDPFGTHGSFGEHNNARLREFLDEFDFSYTFLSATQQYQAGVFDETLLRILRCWAEITEIILPTLGPERRATYSPFMPVCPRTGKVLQVPIIEYSDTTVSYVDPETGDEMSVPVTGGSCKLQWKADWAMRWVALGVDYEMSGKDLIDSVKLSSRIARALGSEPPEGFTYELFLDQEGKKISKSKGNGISVEDWMRSGTKTSLSLFMYHKPREAKKLYEELIPRMEDEFIGHLQRWPEQTAEQRLGNPVWHIENGHVRPADSYGGLTYTLLLNLVSAAQTREPRVLWAYIQKHTPGVSPETHPYLDALVHKAINYYVTKVEPTKVFRAPDDIEREALSKLANALQEIPTQSSSEEVQSIILNVGRSFERYQDMSAKGATPERPGVSGKWFQAIYETLLGQSSGPRIGQFVSLFGAKETCALISSALTRN